MLHAATIPDSADALLPLLEAQAEAERFAAFTSLWHKDDSSIAESHLVLRLHRANYDLWHLEDRARDPHADERVIADVKRAIDRTNQCRNDLVEQVDDALMQPLLAHGLPRAEAPLHSETPGMILDRLSILALKLFHTAEQTERTDAMEEHRSRNRERLAILRKHSEALTGCLANLWLQTIKGERRFELSRQMKM